jgi:hypothetical protein
MQLRFATGAFLALSMLAATSLQGVSAAEPEPSYDQSAIARRGFFYVGGSYVGEPGKRSCTARSMSRC